MKGMANLPNHSEKLLLKSLRVMKGWTQSELALRTGCTAATICRIERGTRNPSPRLAEAIAVELEVLPSHVFERASE